MTCPGAEELLRWLEEGGGEEHLARCPACAEAHAGMRRVRALAGALGRASRGGPAVRPAAPRRRRARPREAVLTSAAAAAVLLALGAEPALRSRIERSPSGAGDRPVVAHVGSHASVFWTVAYAGND